MNCPVCNKEKVDNEETMYRCEFCLSTWENTKLQKCNECGNKMGLVKYMYLDYKDSYQEIAFPYWYCFGCGNELDHKQIEY